MKTALREREGTPRRLATMKHILLTSLAGSALALTACSDSAADDTEAPVAAATSSSDTGDIGANWASRDGYDDDESAGRSEASEKGGQLSLTLPDGVTQAMLGERTKRMIAVQVLLDKSNHSPGVIDGREGANTNRAIRYYREANGLAAGDGIDGELISALVQNQGGDIFRTYTVTEKDAGTEFSDNPEDFAAMAEEDALGYESAREMLAERFHMDEDFLAALNPEADFAKAGTKLVIVSHGDDRIDADIARVEVRKGEATVVGLDEAGKVLVSFPATIGSSKFPSPSGEMKVAAIAPRPNYTFDPDDQEWGPDKTFILPPGPNNPVGGTWIDLGKDGYGIHGSPNPQMVAKEASHGCVRLTNWDAAALAKALGTGTPVVFV